MFLSKTVEHTKIHKKSQNVFDKNSFKKDENIYNTTKKHVNLNDAQKYLEKKT